MTTSTNNFDTHICHLLVSTSFESNSLFLQKSLGQISQTIVSICYVLRQGVRGVFGRKKN